MYNEPGLTSLNLLYMHQSLQPVPGPTVLTYYRALGDVAGARADLLQRPWTHWRDQILLDLSVPHPDLPEKLLRMELTRYGHAMAMPVPGTLAQVQRLQSAGAGRHGALRFADAPRLVVLHDALALEVALQREVFLARLRILGDQEREVAPDDLVRARGVAFEVRTTVHPQLLPPAALETLARELAARGIVRWILQPFSATGCTDEAVVAAAPRGFSLDPALLGRLSRHVPVIEVRG